MDRKTEEFRKRLIATFRVEAAEHIRALSSGLLELEKFSAAEGHAGVLERIFREAHSLKGAARTVNLPEIEMVCQALEDVFSGWQRDEIAPTPALFDLLQQAADLLDKILASLDGGEGNVDVSLSAAMVESLEAACQGAPPVSREQEAPAAARPAPAAPEARPALDTIRISAARLDSLFLETGELLTARLAASQRAMEARELKSGLAPWKRARTELRSHLRPLAKIPNDGHENGSHGGAKMESLARKAIELQERDDQFFEALDSKLTALETSAESDHRSLGRMVDHLIESVKKAVMLPASSLLESFPRLVRDLARDRGKSVELEVRGGDFEMDRRILEEMKEPLIHMLRNAVDHGIEAPAARQQAGKPVRGSLLIDLRREGGDKAVLVVSDDGAGIQMAAVRAAAQKAGIVGAGEKLDKHQELDLIFRSGVSSSPFITDISGRGLGLAIVREKVEKVGGILSVETHVGQGTAFRIVLPLTRSAFRGVVVRVDQQLFVLPTAQVERVLRFRREAIQSVENRDTISVGGRATALVHLRDALRMPLPNHPRTDGDGQLQAVALGSPDRRIAFLIDEVLEEQEVLGKALGPELAGLRNVAGATILGNGRVVPILDVADLLKSAIETSTCSRKATPSSAAAARKKSILVAENSITSRTLLKNILEGAGYTVQTAVDGADAFAALKTSAFDLVVSDVDMPRLNGFALTAKIRGDAKLAGLPVVLVTALRAREDQERGIDAGANAYIVKSSFDQSNLLEAVRRLL